MQNPAREEATRRRAPRENVTFGADGKASFAPSFSPDGTKIVFSRYRSTGGVDVYTMDSDGSG